jgi:hypothetical protein
MLDKMPQRNLCCSLALNHLVFSYRRFHLCIVIYYMHCSVMRCEFACFRYLNSFVILWLSSSMIADCHALSISYSCIMMNTDALIWYDCIFLSFDFQNSIKPCFGCFEIPAVVCIDKVLCYFENHNSKISNHAKLAHQC